MEDELELLDEEFDELSDEDIEILIQEREYDSLGG